MGLSQDTKAHPCESLGQALAAFQMRVQLMRLFLVLLGLVFVAACGSSDPTSSAHGVAQASMRAAVPSAQAPMAFPAPTITDDQFFNWAEATYPQLFPSRELTQQLAPYRFRYYRVTDTYLGVDDAGRVILLGTPTNYQIQTVGTLDAFTPSVVASQYIHKPAAINGLRTIFTNLSPVNGLGTSYEISKAYPAYDIISALGNYPTLNGVFYHNEPLAWALADFNNSGKINLFTARIRYRVSDNLDQVLSSAENYAEYALWELNNGRPPQRIWSITSTCLNPRKAVVADFNQDGRPDLFVACHGYDSPPFPGEKSELLLNNGRGFSLKQIGEVAFVHGASAADINGDGYPDIVVADSRAENIYLKKNPYVYFLINNRDGTFTPDYSRVIDEDITRLFYGRIDSVELIDVDGDAALDLLMGGYDAKGLDGIYSTQTKILYGKDGYFGGRKFLIPRVEVAGSVIDFVKKENFLYICRTGVSNTTNVIQRLNLKTLESEVIYEGSTTKMDMLPGWVGWWIPAASGLRSWNTNIFSATIPY